MGIDLMAWVREATETEEWEKGLPSAMGTASLHEMAADLRQIDMPDEDEERLSGPLGRLETIIQARANAIGLTGGHLAGDSFSRIGCFYQMLCEREIVSRVIQVHLPADERRFLYALDIELRRSAASASQNAAILAASTR